MKRILFSLLLLFFVQGCTSLYDSINPSAAAVRHGCSYQDGHFTKNGNYVSGSYSCPSSTPKSFISSNGCTWVKSYYRKDGTFVTGHTRCKIPKYIETEPSRSNCHYVSGYYRKNGTYVKGYTRCR